MLAPDSQSSIDARIVSGVAVAAGILCAVLIGFWVGDEAFLPLLLFLVIVATGAALLVLRERIWVLVPCFWSRRHRGALRRAAQACRLAEQTIEAARGPGQADHARDHRHKQHRGGAVAPTP
jgi:hypothetical protein